VDGTQELLQKFSNMSEITIIYNMKNVGYTKACNQGIMMSSSKYVLILNPDIQVGNGSVKRLYEYMERYDVAVVGGKLMYFDGKLQYSCRTFPSPLTFLYRALQIENNKTIRTHLMYDFDHGEPRDVDWLLGSCLMIRRKVLDEIGFLDEKYFMYYSDVEFCWRVHKNNWKVTYVPDSEMFHYYQRQSAKGVPGFLALSHLRSAVRFFVKRYIKA
jgi:hypothetical protein